MDQRWDGYYQFFPPDTEVLQMDPWELGPILLRYMTQNGAMTNRFNFGRAIPGGQIAERHMEAWSWLDREGFIARKPNDLQGNDFFITRAGREVVAAEDWQARRKTDMFPDGLDPVLMRTVRPLFARGDYDTAVFRAFKEVEVRVRKKNPNLDGEHGVDLMNQAFGPNGPLMKGADKRDRAAMREMFAGAFSICRNPSAHREVKFDDPREVLDMICFANQLLRIVGRI
jgi:uncharacterized protein (TIGR02391 family)